MSQTATLNKCIIGISDFTPYDTSVFVNNETTYYTRITYGQMHKLSEYLTDSSKEVTELNLQQIISFIKTPNTLVMFRFLCSRDCRDGLHFLNSECTRHVFLFLKIITSQPNKILVEFSDHSMGSLFTNWNTEFMGMVSPIIISRETTTGLFKLQATKQALINSCHPTLQQVGQMSQDEEIVITFNNMSGTKVFSVREDAENVTILSKGCTMDAPSIGRSLLKEIKDRPTIEEQVVQCEFPYQNGMIIVSSTHWCNLEHVESKIDVEKLRTCYKETYGEKAGRAFDNRLFSVTRGGGDYRSFASRAVKEISSGTPINKQTDDNEES